MPTWSQIVENFDGRFLTFTANLLLEYHYCSIIRAIRCTVPGCSCECFTPGKQHIRFCENCSHGWVPHALDKLGFRQVLGQCPVEPVQPNVAFDIASLVLYGCQALPIRLKILLDRLFSVLQRDEVVQVLRGFGWTHEDYARGYILQEPHGAVLDRWNICSPEEEPLVLQQFLRFGETRAITQQLLLHGLSASHHQHLPRIESDIKKFIERAATGAGGAGGGGERVGRGGEGERRRSERERESKDEPKISIKPIQSLQQPPVHQVPLRQTSPPPQKPSVPPPPVPSMSFLKLPPTNGPLPASPPNSISSSPVSVSPLNRLQNMQPFDFRKLASAKGSPERRRTSETSDASPPGLMNLVVTSPVPQTTPLPPPPPTHTTIPPPPVAPLDLHSGANTAASSEFGSDDDDDTTIDDDSHSALNLSRDAPQKLPTTRQGRQPGSQHQRKASTPVKRQWGSSSLPLNLGTQLINPATGKKRVQCNVCLKTFCDKGALKIHFSAVHLREMHKCTVEGCNMMFSSRRSRNRHSANPNPKLHSPHLRRKISPHDGRTAQSHPLFPPIPPSALNPLTFGSFPLLTPPPQAAVLDLKQSLDLSLGRKDSMSEEYMMDEDDEEGIVVVGEDEDNYDKPPSTEGSMVGNEEIERSKRLKMSESDVDIDDYNDESNEDSLSVRPETKVTRKRKSQNPTRCAQPSAMMTDEDGNSDEESSNDVVFPNLEDTTSRNTADENEKTDDFHQNNNENGSDHHEEEAEDMSMKTVAEDSVKAKERRLSMDEEEEEEDNDTTVEKNGVGHHQNHHHQHNHDDHDDVDDTDGEYNKNQKSPTQNHIYDNGKVQLKKNLDDETSQHCGEEDEKKTTTNNNEDSCNALRQLENLSQTRFGECSPTRSQSPRESASGSVSDCGSDVDNGDVVYGHFEDGTFIRAMDVPIDKDNPRMCTACGKVFQNHFGVKTHYQNVHLKLMHKCTVDGCNAAFPSKRSRDRHSANLNLHRKLLSAGDKVSGSMFLEGSTNFHADFLSRIYGGESGGLAHHPLPPPGVILNGDHLPPHPPIFMPHLGYFPHLGAAPLNGHNSRSNSPPSPGGSPSKDEDSGYLPCKFCQKSLPNPTLLQDHYHQFHPTEMSPCPNPGCGRLFTSQRKRDAHCERDCVHKQSIS
ncbi:hypothetical protein LSTR_LSTR011349 [Laodelphax striatellus]|uniref:C2H2-type domain-containing protein n=1 Tax=Laodelphax striatellus TaxID=195883 RepID=A0A482XK03_LAOST|nr:hypothetical protein LSTR_LSTR011349 [Laodelphax striatellus]